MTSRAPLPAGGARFERALLKVVRAAAQWRGEVATAIGGSELLTRRIAELDTNESSQPQKSSLALSLLGAAALRVVHCVRVRWRR